MSINREIKGQLARLLATENLVIEHKQVPTASFDVQNRVLVLPVWNRASSVVYDLLVGHEVGHALFTPNEDWTKRVKIPKDYINVIEDARIEKMMKRKYPGLAKSFFSGYKELHTEDFFGVEDTDLNTLSLIDRINLHFKIGSHIMMPFTEEERAFVIATEKAETFDDVIKICEALKKYISEKPMESIPQKKNSGSQEGSSSPNYESSQSDEADGDKEGEGKKQEAEDNQREENTSRGGSLADENVSQTQRSFDDSTEELTSSNRHHRDITYLELAEVYEDRIIVNNEEVHKRCSDHWEHLDDTSYKESLHVADSQYQDFKKTAQKEVNYLVKEFECRKSASAYARASTSKTGVIDTQKLHSYTYNEDIFKKVTVLPDGKNHGMIFILDWSGSMQEYLMDTVKQLLNLMWFCRKVQIPFDVYAFTYCWADPYRDGDMQKYERGHNKIGVNELFSLLHFFTSDCNNRVFEEQCKNIWRTAFSLDRSRYSGMSIPCGLDLSGTPLNETIITLSKIIPNFKKKTNAEKVTVCILTDGESNPIHHDISITRHDKEILGKNAVDYGKCLRDRKTGRVYKEFEVTFDSGTTNILIQNLKDRFPEVNLIGFRISSGSDFGRTYRSVYNTYNDNQAMASWRKEKSWVFKYSGWDAVYYIASHSMSQDKDNFEIDSEASKVQITKAFKKMLRSKTVNKKILNSFATLVS